MKSANDYLTVALMCLLGYYGNGSARTEALTRAGFDPERVQKLINIAFER